MAKIWTTRLTGGASADSRLVMGIQRKNNGFLMDDEDEKYRVAVHEIGHTFMALYRPLLKGLGASLDSGSLG